MISSPVPSLAILVSAVLVLSCGQTDRITDADDCYTHYTHVTTVRMSMRMRTQMFNVQSKTDRKSV